MPGSATANQGREIVLSTENVPPPHCIYLTQADQLTILATATLGCQLRITARIILADGSLAINQWDMPTFTNVGGFNTFSCPLSEGFLLSVTVTNQVASRRGQTYVRLQLLRGGDVTGTTAQILAQGYVSFFSQVFWPDFQSENCASGMGNLRKVTGTLPGFGAEISETVPTGLMWRILSIWYKLATSAVVANRFPHLLLDDGVSVLVDTPPFQAQAASLTLTYQSFTGGQSLNVADTIVGLRFPVDIRLMGGGRIRTSTTALDGGDRFTAPVYLVEEWIQL